jgi:UDP-glucose 4-epimerase
MNDKTFGGINMTVLVLGGAGYIGSHTVDQLVNGGYDVAVVDNLITGHTEAVNPAARLYVGDVRDKEFMRTVFTKENVEGVVHFAAFSVVPESMQDPLKYFDNNTAGMIHLLEVMNEFDVKNIVFSSTAATYGEPKQIPIKETDPQIPTNPYGESKLAMEKIMHWSDLAYGIKFVALRYFNVAGAKPDGSIGEDHNPETHLIPIILQVAEGKRDKLQIFGDDYPTPDGTNVRDYVHVLDLADAHILALKYLAAGNDSNAFNLGSATGFSNLQILDAARKATGKEIPAEMAPRRPGDPSTLIASSDKAREILGWKPNYDDVEKIIGTAWTWHETHPDGYSSK